MVGDVAGRRLLAGAALAGRGDGRELVTGLDVVGRQQMMEQADADAGVIHVEETMIGGAAGWMGRRSDLRKRDRDQCVVPVILGGLDSPCMSSPDYPWLPA
ncbi:hypothetical protein ACLOJK_027692 [Asimina triloba]